MPATYHAIRLQQDAQAIRTQEFNGKEHIVVPAIGLVEGVLHGANSAVPELALTEEFGKFPESWNGRPVTLGHPRRNDAFVSAAAAPEIFSEEAVGTIFNTSLDGAKLKMEFFLDPGKTSAEAVQRLRSGSTVEVSTGFFAEVIPVEGNFQGEDFGGVLTSIAPDHVAILGPDGVGACSVEDGCGVPRINSLKINRDGSFVLSHPTGKTCGCAAGETCDCETLRTEVRSTARRPTFSGTESSPWSSPSLEDYKAAFSGDTDFSSVAKAPAAFKRFVAAHTLLGDPGASDLRNLAFFPVVRPSTGKLNENALRAVLGGRGAQAMIPESARASAREEARRLLQTEFNVKLESLARRKAFNNFFRLDGRKAVDLGESRPKGLAETPESFVVINDSRETLISRHKGLGEAEAAAEKAADREGITTIVGRAVGKQGRTTIWKDVVGFVGEAKKMLDNDKNVAENDPDGTERGNFLSTLVENVKRLLQREERMDKAELIAKVIANEALPFGEEDIEALEAFSEERLEALGVAVADEVEAPDEPEADLETFTKTDAYEDLPDAVRDFLDRSLAAEKAKVEVLAKKVAEAKGSPYTFENLQSKSIDELERLAAWVEKLTAEPEDFSGRGAPKTEEEYVAPRMGRIFNFGKRDAA